MGNKEASPPPLPLSKLYDLTPLGLLIGFLTIQINYRGGYIQPWGFHPVLVGVYVFSPGFYPALVELCRSHSAPKKLIMIRATQ
jgi:hypothetical protein